MLRTIVIGFGFLGKWHVQKALALPARCELVAIIEINPTAQESARLAHPFVKVLASWQEIKDEFDVAVVASPTSFHFQLVKELLLAKKHVFCEKPLCAHSHEARQLETYASAQGLILQVGHSERCHAVWESLAPELRSLSGALSVRIDRFAPFKGRATDVDVVQDLMVHDIDLMLWIFKRKILTVKAWGHKIRTSHWDHVTAQFTLDGLTEVTITVGRNSTHEVRALEVVHSGGVVRVDLFGNKLQRAPADQIADGLYVSEETYPKRDHLLLEQENFYCSVAGLASPIVTGSEGREVVEVLSMVLEALESQQVIRSHV